MDFIWQSAWTFLVGLLPEVSPIWGYGLKGAGIIVAFIALGWFFIALRPLAGAVTLAVLAWLHAYWTAEQAAKAKQKAADEQAKEAQPKDNWPSFPRW